MNEHCKDSILVAHNAKSFDLYPILEVLIDRHAVRPDKIIYNGTKEVKFNVREFAQFHPNETGRHTKSIWIKGIV